MCRFISAALAAVLLVFTNHGHLLADPIPKSKAEPLIWIYQVNTGILLIFDLKGTEVHSVKNNYRGFFHGFRNQGTQFHFKGVNGKIDQRRNSSDVMNWHVCSTRPGAEAVDLGIGSDWYLSDDLKNALKSETVRKADWRKDLPPIYKNSLYDQKSRKSTTLSLPENIRLVRWADDKHIIAAEEKKSGNTFHLYSIDGGKLREIFSTQNRFRPWQQISQNLTHFTETDMLPEQKENPETTRHSYQLIVKDSAHQKPVEIDKEYGKQFVNSFFSPQCNYIAYQIWKPVDLGNDTYTSGPAEIKISDIEGKNPRTIFLGKDHMDGVVQFGWLPSKKCLDEMKSQGK